MGREPVILLADPHLSGHHLSYLEWIAAGADRFSWRVVIATSSSDVTDPRLQPIADLPGIAEIVGIDCDARDEPSRSPLTLLRKDLAYRSFFRSAYQAVSMRFDVQHVMVPYLDYCFWSMSVLGPGFDGAPLTAIMMRTAFLKSQIDADGSKPSFGTHVRTRLLRRLLAFADVNSVFFIDPMLRDSTLVRDATRGSKLRYLPDPSVPPKKVSRDAARRSFGIPDNVFVILIYGMLVPRKGVRELLDAVDRLGMDAAVHVLAVGKQDEAVATLLANRESNMSNLHVYPRFADDGVEGNAFSAANSIWLGYRNHPNMSGVLVKAGMAGLPVLACDDGAIGWMTANHGLGLTFDINDITDIAAAIARLSQEPETCSRLGAAGETVFAEHTLTEFQDRIFSTFERRQR